VLAGLRLLLTGAERVEIQHSQLLLLLVAEAVVEQTLIIWVVVEVQEVALKVMAR